MFDTEEERNLSPIIALQKVYLAPELMLRAKHCTDAVDSWACGCIIAEMCTCKRLFPHIGDKHDVDPYLRGVTRVLEPSPQRNGQQRTSYLCGRLVCRIIQRLILHGCSRR
ncbi:hypothetical protein ACFX2I_005350 [Malus domestica]